jgi:hypothetical protein
LATLLPHALRIVRVSRVREGHSRKRKKVRSQIPLFLRGSYSMESFPGLKGGSGKGGLGLVGVVKGGSDATRHDGEREPRSEQVVSAGAQSLGGKKSLTSVTREDLHPFYTVLGLCFAGSCIKHKSVH